MNKKALVVFSGGQDSTTCLFLAIQRYGRENVHALTFAYGQRHSKEIEVAKDIATQARIASHKILNVDWYKDITQNALMNDAAPIVRNEGCQYPNTFVEGRNALFLLTASIYAKNIGADELYIGVSEADYSGYPDCREVFIKAMNKAITLAMDCEISINAPLQHMTKAEEWALADRMGVLDFIRAKTLTCYNGIIGAGCGECPACKLREKGFREYINAKKKEGRND